MLFILGWVTIVLSVVSYAFYFRDIFRGITKPNSITRLVWSFLYAFIFIQQVRYDGGPGAWVTGLAALASVAIFIASLRYGDRNVTRLDWVCLVIALLAICIWQFTSSVELSVILASSVFVIGLIPTIRKSRTHASEETAITYGLNSLKFFISIFALTNLSLITGLYPLVLCVANGLFFAYLLMRQSSLRKVVG